MPSLKPHGQMSEAFYHRSVFSPSRGGFTGCFIPILYRGKVFANAQTGNIVLMAVKLFAGRVGARHCAT